MRRTGCVTAMMLGLGIAMGTRGLQAQAVTPVPVLQFGPFEGAWYEVERLPNKAEKKCTGDAFWLIAEAQKATQLQTVHTCRVKSGVLEANNVMLKRQDKHGTDGKLKVSYLFFFSHKRWVLAMGSQAEWVLLGSPNHKELWVLSRTQSLEPGVLAAIEAKAAGEGYDMSKMVKVVQDAPVGGSRVLGAAGTTPP